MVNGMTWKFVASVFFRDLPNKVHFHKFQSLKSVNYDLGSAKSVTKDLTFHLRCWVFLLDPWFRNPAKPPLKKQQQDFKFIWSIQGKSISETFNYSDPSTVLYKAKKLRSVKLDVQMQWKIDNPIESKTWEWTCWQMTDLVLSQHTTRNMLSLELKQELNIKFKGQKLSLDD